MATVKLGDLILVLPPVRENEILEADYAKTGGIGKFVPHFQYAGGGGQIWEEMSFLLDAGYQDKADIEDDLATLRSYVKPQGLEGVPPKISFTYGQQTTKVVIRKLTIQVYRREPDSLVALQAEVKVTLQGVATEQERTPREERGHRIWTIGQNPAPGSVGEDMRGIAYRVYGDEAYWKVLAICNAGIFAELGPTYPAGTEIFCPATDVAESFRAGLGRIAGR